MTVREVYDAVGGDYDDVYSRIPKEAAIERFIRKYAETKEVDNLIAAYDERDYRKVFEITHNLKGMSANLSLAKNNVTVSQICELVRNGEPSEDIGALVEKAKEEHDYLLSQVALLG